MRAALIVCVRSFSSITKSKNPTWPKLGGVSSNKDFMEIASDSLTRFDEYYLYSYKSSEREPKQISREGECIFTIHDAAELTLPEKVDLIFTSPPYCNRLDGFTQYSPENYFLSAINGTTCKMNLIGTVRVKEYQTFEEDFDYLITNSEYAKYLLSRIKQSSAPDDPAYYLKYYTRYFAKLCSVVIKSVELCTKWQILYCLTR